MKRFLKFFIPVVVLSALVYQFRVPLRADLIPFWYQIRQVFWHSDPCKEPIVYNLGTFDTKFNISKKYFLSALLDAEAIWEKPYGQEFFNYSGEATTPGTLKINLIYDYRQEATTKLASLGIVVSNNKASYDSLKTKFDNLKTQYETGQAELDARVKIFNQKQAEYSAEVESWNRKGGAPKAQYEALEETRSELEAEAKQLQKMQTDLNNKADEINALVVALNRLVDSLNLSVAKYNTTNVSRGESFEEGVYISDGVNKEIDIYEFSNRQKLVRVLAHELGHALGLDHVSDPKAIMYELNQGNNEVLSKADLDALKTKCGVK